jgi:HlyD family secretion protein
MWRRWIKWIILLLVIAGIGLLIWHFTRPKPVEVIVKPVSKGPVEHTVANTRAGTVKACRRAKLSPSVGGQISKLPIHKGDEVKQGQLLLELWNDDLTAQSELAKQELEASQSQSKAACLKADVAKRNADRLVLLGKQEVVSKEQVDNAVTDASAQRAQCNSTFSEIGMRQARIKVLEADLDRTRLVAPFDGVVAEINGELFEFVTPSPIGIATPPVVDLIENSCFYVTAPIDEVDASGIRVGMPARITMDAFRGEKFQGHVRRIADYVLDVEKQARTVDVEASFDQPPEKLTLLAGYSADIEVILNVRPDTVRVPTEALFDENKVYLFDSGKGLLIRREIEKGIANWQWTEVLKGLSEGDRVVVNVDNPNLKDGEKAVISGEKP